MKKMSCRILIPLILIACLCFTGCLRYSSNILEVTRATEPSYAVPNTTLPLPSQAETPSAQPSTTLPVPQTTIPAETTLPAVTQPVPQTTVPAVTAAPEPTAPREKDPSEWSKDEIVANLTKAINTAKAYTGNLTVDHTEEFTMNITKCPGGSIGLNLANSVAANFIKPTQETLQYSGGTAVDKDGKTVPILLPKRSNFSLSSAGVKSAKAFKSGANTVIEITLISETSTLDTLPKVNAGAIGYLDINEVDLKIVTIKSFEVTYSGSSMIVNIDPQGKVLSISYQMPVNVVASGSSMGISGEVALDGAEKEVWKLNW